MPNLRGKTWTTSTPANVEDAQYWEDHLISDTAASKAASSVQSVNNTTPDAQGNVDIVALPDGGTVGQVLTKQSSVDGDADWEDPASSGHTIEDEDGNTMPYQETLQFENAEVTNDSVNNKTIVDCKGSKGDAATITVGTVTTLPAGSQATVNNSGTSSDAVFDFGIPKGADGAGAVDSVNGYTGVVVLNASDVGALPDSTTIPTKTSELDNDSGFVTANDVPTSLSELSDDATHRLVTDAEKTAWDAKVSESLLKSTVGWTGKNLIPYPYFREDSYTTNGITFTVNSDGSVTANGTATNTAQYHLATRNVTVNETSIRLNKGERYILTGCPSGGSASTYSLYMNGYIEGTTDSDALHNDYGSGVTWTEPTDYYINHGALIRIESGVSVNNLTFYPMLRDASITDDTYEPYHESVEEEIEQIYADNGVLGAKNLLNSTYAGGTVNGVTITANDNKTYKLNGAPSSGNMAVPLYVGTFPVGRYILNGVPDFTTYGARLHIRETAGASQVNAIDTGKGIEFAIPSATTSYSVFMYLNSGYTANNLIIKPMLRLASDPDDTYVPYAMTNRELTDAVTPIESAVTDIISGASVDTSNMGNHLRKVGKIVFLELSLSGVTATAWTDIVFKIPNGFKPKNDSLLFRDISNQTTIKIYQGSAMISSNLSNAGFQMQTSWVTS